MDRENADGSFVHRQAREAHAELLNRMKTSPATEEFARQENARPWQGSKLVNAEASEEAGKVDVPGFERQVVVFTTPTGPAGNQSNVVSMAVPQQILDRQGLRDQMIATNWDLQAFLDELFDMERQWREAGSAAAIEVSQAHRADLEAYKQRVADVALKHGMAHNWCSEVLECLDELGIKVGPTHVTAHVRIPHTIEMKLPFEEIGAYRENPEKWVESKIENFRFTNTELRYEAQDAGIKLTTGDGYLEDVELGTAKVLK